MVNQNETDSKNKMITSGRKFSRSQLIVFALVFAAVGGYALYKTFANQPVEGLLHTNGTLVQSADRRVYLIEDGKLRPVSYEVYQTYGYTTQEVRKATEADSKLPAGEPLPLAEGAIVKEGDKTYQIESSDGILKKRLLEDSQRLGQLNTGLADITQLRSPILPKETLDPLKDFTGKERHPNGTVVLSGDGKNYVIEAGQRRPVPSTAIGLTHRLPLRGVTAQSEGDKALPIGPALQPREGSVVQGSGETIYVIEKVKSSSLGGFRSTEVLTKRPIRSQQAFLSYSYQQKDVVKISDTELLRLPIGISLPQSPNAPVQVIITPKQGENSKTLSQEFIKNYGAKLRHIYPEWFSIEVPHDQSEKIKVDPRVQKMKGNVQIAAQCMTDATIQCAGPSACHDGSDNDGDGKTDYPADPGCTDASDNDEYNAPPPQPAPPQPQPPPPPAGQPPTSESDPTIDGIAKVGQVLVGGTGAWGNGVDHFSFKWQRCTNDQPEGYGSGCTDTGGNAQNYQLVEADRTFRIRVIITASNQYGAGPLASSRVTLPVGSGQVPGPQPAPPPPSPGQPVPTINRWEFAGGNTWLYSVSLASRCEVHLQTGGIQPFTPTLGGTSSVTAGNGNTSGQLWCWNNSVGPVTSGWAGPSTPTPPPPNPGIPAPTISLWKFNSGNSWTYSVTNANYCEVHLSGSGIQPFTPSASQSSVTAGNGNQSGQLKCWNNSVGPTVSAWTGPTAQPPPSNPPSGPKPLPDQYPVITGSPVVGQTLFASSGSWKNGVQSFSYQWYRCGGVDSLGYGVNCAAILSAKEITYKLVDGDQGNRMVIKVTAKNSYGSTSAGSLATGVVTNAGSVASQFTSEPASPVAKGVIVGVKWYMQYGGNCVASAQPANPNWNGPKPPAGNQSVGVINVTTTFFISCNYPGSINKVKTELKVVIREDNPPPAPGPGPSPPSGKNCTPGANWGVSRPDLASQVLTLVNQRRTNLGLAKLNTSGTLSASAQWKSLHMAKYKYMTHEDPAPPVARTFPKRVDDCGYPPGSAAGENIAYGYTTAQAVMNAWVASPGHKANLDNSSWRVIGLGVASSADGTLYWAQNFGTTQDSAKPAAAPITSEPTSRVVVVGALTTPFQTHSPHLARVGATASGGGPAGSIAVLDTGVERHPLLNVADGINCIAGDTSPATQDDHGHGTMVAGVIGAKGDGINTPRGIAPGTTIIPIKIAGPTGAAELDDIICGIREASARAGTVNISMALGTVIVNGAPETNIGSCSSSLLHQEICNSKSRIVAAAGNSAQGISESSFGRYAGIIAVTAMHDNDGLPGGQDLGAGGLSSCSGDDMIAGYSGYDNGAAGTVIAAPGCVFTTIKGGGSKRGFGGTSAAAPMVAAGGLKTDSSSSYMYIPPANGYYYGPLLRL